MKPADIVRAAIPDADDGLAECILWSRTAFPFQRVTARELYRAAHGLRRAAQNGVRLCDWCHRPARAEHWTCANCGEALSAMAVLETIIRHGEGSGG